MEDRQNLMEIVEHRKLRWRKTSWNCVEGNHRDWKRKTEDWCHWSNHLCIQILFFHIRDIRQSLNQSSLLQIYTPIAITNSIPVHVIINTSKCQQIALFLQKIHWRPIKQQIYYNFCLLTHVFKDVLHHRWTGTLGPDRELTCVPGEQAWTSLLTWHSASEVDLVSIWKWMRSWAFVERAWQQHSFAVRYFGLEWGISDWKTKYLTEYTSGSLREITWRQQHCKLEELQKWAEDWRRRHDVVPKIFETWN